jgi:hypothetical protein
MLISSESGAGEIVSASEDTRFYDDVACLAADWARRPPGAHAFVRIAGGSWSDVYAASYAQPSEAHTAMGSGLVAFASIAEARAVDRAHRAWTFDDVVRQTGALR